MPENRLATVMAAYREWKQAQDETQGEPIPAEACECPPFGTEAKAQSVITYDGRVLSWGV